jgi:uncharacterized protein YxeA
VSVGAQSEDSFVVTFDGAAPDQIKAYVEKVKSAGFTVDADTQDMEMQGMFVYTYSAYNSDGYEIMVYSAAGSTGLTINRP